MAPPPRHWLLLHGLGCTAAVWRDFPQRLVAATGARVHTLDLPGVGDASDRRVPVDVAVTVDDLRGRWLPLRGGSSWGVLGLSLGGMLAMNWTQRFAGDFTRLVLVSSSAGRLSRPWQRLTPRGTWTVGRILATSSPPARQRRLIRLTLNDPGRRADALSAAGELTRRAVPRRAWVRQLTAATRYVAPGRINVPAFVLASDGDRMVEPSCSRRLAGHLAAPLAMHPSAGHDLPGDAGDWLASSVAAWLAQPAPKAGP